MSIPRYKIIVKALQGTILTYSVNVYTISHGFVEFVDRKTRKIKRFAVANTEIEEEKGDCAYDSTDQLH